MKRFLFLLVITSISLNLYPFEHTHKDKYELRYINYDRQLNIGYQQYLRNQDLWQNYLSLNPDWYVQFNENNQLPHRAFGKPVLLNNGSSNTDKVMNFLTTNNFILPNDLRLSNESRNEKSINLSWIQYYKDLHVINSRLYAKLSLNNQLVLFGLDIHNDINIGITPNIDFSTAVLSASQNIIHAISSSRVDDELKILPIPIEDGGYEYNLVYVVHIETRIDQGPANYICYVDAHDAELLMRKNTVFYESPSSPPSAIVNISGEVYTSHPYNPSSIKNMVDLKARDQVTLIDYYTDSNGDVNLPTANGTNIRYKLEGEFADVQTNGSTPDIISPLGTTNTIVFDNSNSTIQERTAYYGVHMIHTHLKSVFPAFTDLDSPMETNVDEAGSCNAYYDGSSINFYAEGGGCHATAKIIDVVYHEYGHAINGTRYNGSGWGGGMQNGGLNEGFADLWAITLTESPILGHGWDLQDPAISVRRYDQDRKVYPQDLVGEVHADGEIIAGAFWDTYLNLGSMPQMIDLFKYTFDGGADGPNGDEGTIYTDILLEVLYADDNDANLSNGTPNDLAITQAFALHGITLLSNAVISHSPTDFVSGNLPVSINANISLTYPWALSTTDCYYRLNKDTNWVNLPMNGNGNSWQVNIPSQTDGTIISYYISLTDINGYESGILPIASNISPINNANLPFFTLVGYELVREEDFDFNNTTWFLGDINDNATTGMWEIGTPIASYDDPMNFSGIVQTGTQHTLNGSQCAYTQNASSILDGIGANDVDGGHTTLFSPYFDLTGYTNPAFSYYRWYTNSPSGGANPGADWWQVLITDDFGSTWHYVENNKSSDVNWRKFAFRAQDYVNLTNGVQLKFIASDSLRLGQNLDGGSLIEGAVDDLYLYEAQSATFINEINRSKRTLVRITDILGRDVNPEKLSEQRTLFYIYDDGTIRKKILID